jgi:hypothetical protein
MGVFDPYYCYMIQSAVKCARYHKHAELCAIEQKDNRLRRYCAEMAAYQGLRYVAYPGPEVVFGLYLAVRESILLRTGSIPAATPA